MRLRPDAGTQLRRALCANFADFEVESLESQAWASITFSGERHRLVLRLDGPEAAAAADAFLPGLAEREFTLRGHILADISLVAQERGADLVRLTLEALTIEES
jgi:hypothetical protein